MQRHGPRASAPDDFISHLTPFVADSHGSCNRTFLHKPELYPPSGRCGVYLYAMRCIQLGMAYMSRRPSRADEQRFSLASVRATFQFRNSILHKAIIFDSKLSSPLYSVHTAQA